MNDNERRGSLSLNKLDMQRLYKTTYHIMEKFWSAMTCDFESSQTAIVFVIIIPDFELSDWSAYLIVHHKDIANVVDTWYWQLFEDLSYKCRFDVILNWFGLVKIKNPGKAVKRTKKIDVNYLGLSGRILWASVSA